jgi:hypothetical protein
MLRILTLLLIIAACATEPTKYGKYVKKSGGYQDKTLEGNFRVVSFKANSNTKSSLATKYATFRAIEICTSSQFKLTHLLDTFDKTQSKTVTRTSTNGYPSYYYGMSPFYSRYSGFGFGYTNMQSSSWNETLKYPEIEVVFECANEVYEPGIVLREVSSEEMKHLIKDLHGGLQVERIPKEAPKSQLKVGDIIIMGDGMRIQQNYELLSLFHKSKDHEIRVDILRDGVTRRGLSLKGVDASDKILEAQNTVIESVCKQVELKINPLCKI